MIFKDMEKFRAAVHVCRVEKCCGTCRHFHRYYSDAACTHPKQREFDTDCRENEPYDAFDGTNVNEGFICDLWEKEESVDEYDE